MSLTLGGYLSPRLVELSTGPGLVPGRSVVTFPALIEDRSTLGRRGRQFGLAIVVAALASPGLLLSGFGLPVPRALSNGGPEAGSRIARFRPARQAQAPLTGLPRWRPADARKTDGRAGTRSAAGVRGEWKQLRRQPLLIERRAPRIARPVQRSGLQGGDFRVELGRGKGDDFVLTPQGNPQRHRALQYQFRPLDRKRRKTYEELSAERGASYPPAPGNRSMPTMPGPYLPGYANPWMLR